MRITTKDIVDFVGLVKTVRSVQTRYFKTRSQKDLSIAKKLEAVLDNKVANWLHMFDTIERTKAPWSDIQIAFLETRQTSPNIHPYTCNRESPKCEKKADPNKDGVLKATKDGWICPCGEYKQDWY